MNRPVIAVFLAVMAGCGGAGGEDSTWTSASLEDTVAKASRSGKPILAYFTADW